MKFSGYCYYMNTNMQGDFQICISVSLKEEKGTWKKCCQENLAIFATFSSRDNLFSDSLRHLIPAVINFLNKCFPSLAFFLSFFLFFFVFFCCCCCCCLWNLFKDAHRKKASSNKIPVLTKSRNMGTWVVVTSN